MAVSALFGKVNQATLKKMEENESSQVIGNVSKNISSMSMTEEEEEEEENPDYISQLIEIYKYKFSHFASMLSFDTPANERFIVIQKLVKIKEHSQVILAIRNSPRRSLNKIRDDVLYLYNCLHDEKVVKVYLQMLMNTYRVLTEYESCAIVKCFDHIPNNALRMIT